uniref:Integrase catalytic domain-containing protein n=1 Tax=Panagrellus redivivus TaxID=6233 RepID=A0A7E4VSF7_PANRE
MAIPNQIEIRRIFYALSWAMMGWKICMISAVCSQWCYKKSLNPKARDKYAYYEPQRKDKCFLPSGVVKYVFARHECRRCCAVLAHVSDGMQLEIGIDSMTMGAIMFGQDVQNYL